MADQRPMSVEAADPAAVAQDMMRGREHNAGRIETTPALADGKRAPANLRPSGISRTLPWLAEDHERANLRAENERLRAENERLRAENERLEARDTAWREGIKMATRRIEQIEGVRE